MLFVSLVILFDPLGISPLLLCISLVFRYLLLAVRNCRHIPPFLDLCLPQAFQENTIFSVGDVVHNVIIPDDELFQKYIEEVVPEHEHVEVSVYRESYPNRYTCKVLSTQGVLVPKWGGIYIVCTR